MMAAAATHGGSLPTLAKGDRLAAWVVVEALAYTDHASVYLGARADGSGAPVVLKLLGSTSTGSRHAEEIGTLRLLDHPNLARLVDAGIHDEMGFVVLSHIDGVPLSSLLDRPLPQATVLSIGRQLAAGLAHAHGHGVAHRDIKPDNVMVCTNGQVVLTDFGIAQRSGHERLTHTLARSPGTPAYAPPEWFDDRLADGQAADAYSLGVLLYELCHGRRAFRGLRGRALQSAKAGGPLAAPASCGILMPWIASLTAPRAQDRPTLAALVEGLGSGGWVPLHASATLPSAPCAPASPHTVGRYRVLEELGRGGMGVVMRAFDPELDREVALKLTERVGASLDQVRREARAVARLRHPHIVGMLDVGPHGDGLFLAMELIDGRDLATVLAEDGPRPVDEALDLIKEVGAALAHAHAHDIVHRDVKPANVLVDTQGVAHLADFGLATTLQEDARLTAHGELQGTPLYMAPEQARGDRDQMGPRTDVYALGAVLFELVSGTSAIGEGNTAEVLHAIATMERAPRLRSVWPEAPVDLERLCARAMEVEPTQRYPSMEAMLSDVARLRRGEPLEGGPRLTLRRAAWWWQRHRSARRVVTALVLGAAGLMLAQEAQERWTRQQSDAEAQARLEGLRDTLERQAHDPAASQAAFEAFVTLDENQGTSVLAEAWRDRAARLAEGGQHEEARRALARAYRDAVTPKQQQDALLQLMRSQARDWRWTDLDASSQILAERFPARAAQPEALVLSRLRDVALRRPAAPPRGDLSRARRLLPGAPFTEERWPSLMHQDLGGDEAWLWADAEALYVLGDQLEIVDTLAWPPGSHPARAMPLQVDGRAHLVAPTDDAVLVMTVDRQGTTLQARFPMPRARNILFSAAAMDVDGDGGDEILLGRLDRHLQVMRRSSDGSWVLEELEAHADSEVRALMTTDVDGDGREELLLAAGAWSAYDLRWLIGHADGSLRLVSRARLGSVVEGVLVEGPDGLEVWTLVTGDGLHRHRLTPDGLVATERVPLPPKADNIGRPVVFDLDGDGLQDLAVAVEDDLWLLRRVDEHRMESEVIADLAPFGAHDVDGDGADELLVEDRQGNRWILGTGEERLPSITTPTRPPTPQAEGWLAGVQERSADLFAMGFAPEAADALSRVADLQADATTAAQLRVQAAEYLEEAGRLQQAHGLYAQAASIPALRGALRCAEAMLDLESAQAHTKALAPQVGPRESAELLARMAERSALLEGPTLTLAFDTSWPGHLFQELDPLLARWAPQSGTLEVDTVGGIVAVIPVRTTGERLSVEFEGTLTSLEWSSGVGVFLRQPQGDVVLGMILHGHGGGGRLRTAMHVSHGGRPTPVELARSGPLGPALGPFRTRVDWLPAEREAAWVLEGLGSAAHHRWMDTPTEIPEFLELVIVGRREPGVTARAQASISTIRVRGAEAVPVPADPLRDAAAQLMGGDPEAARQTLRPLPFARAQILQLLALAQLGKWSEAEQAMADLPVDGQLDTLRRWIRLGPRRLHPAIATALGDRAPRLFWDAWSLGISETPDAPDVLTVFTEGPLGSMDLTAVAEPLATDILLARAVASRLTGKLPLAKAQLAEAAQRQPSGPSSKAAAVATEQARLAQLTGEVGVAITHLDHALERSPTPELLLEQMHDDPSLSVLLTDPRWPAPP